MLRIIRPFHPILYQGAGKRAGYFEGWYFKQTTNNSGNSSGVARTVSLIPGISRSAAGDRAFVQMIDGASGLTRYFPFSAEEFSATDEPFGVRVGDNRFSLSGIHVDLKDSEGSVRGDLVFGKTVPPVSSFLNPGVMGPYSFVPFMECYHGIASLDHRADGIISIEGTSLRKSGESISFEDGRGYIEKDWGRSMPRSWIWVQSNSFELQAGPASLFFSFARIPWLGSHFNGCICILYAGGVQYRFATYTGAKVEQLVLDGQSIHVVVGDPRYSLVLNIHRNHEGSLAAPVGGAMDRRIAESADSRVRVQLKRRLDEVILFDSVSEASGVEVVGDMALLAP